MKENDFVVKPLANKKADFKSAFHKLFVNPYANVVIVGNKCSGKTTTIYRILEEVVKKGMNVVIFTPTIHSDDTYKEILKMLDKKGARVLSFEHFIDFDSGVCQIDELVKSIEKENEMKEQILEDEKKPQQQIVNFGDKPKETTYKSKKKKKVKTTNLRPETVIVLDDLSSDLTKQNIMYRCLNKNRHNKIMALIACHSCVDLRPGAFNQADYLLLYPQLPYEKVIDMQDKIGLSSNESTKKDNLLLQKYKEATQQGGSKYDFLLIDKKDNSFRRNFNTPL